MINKWILNNFKSINQEKTLEFRPLTIFTGANSSGKSTILQSILLVTQTLQNQNSSRSIVLNGGIKKFGSYGDIVYHRDCNKDITVGFDIDNNLNNEMQFMSPWDEGIKNLSCRFVVGGKDVEDLQPYLIKMSLDSIVEGSDKKAKFSMERLAEPLDKVKEIVESMTKKPNADELLYKVTEKRPSDFSLIRFERRSSESYIGVSLHHFLPGYLLSAYNEILETSFLLKHKIYYSVGRYGLVDDELNKYLSESLESQCSEAVDSLQKLVKNSDVPVKAKNTFVRLCEKFHKNREFNNFVDVVNNCILPDDKKIPVVEKVRNALLDLPDRYNINRIHGPFIPGVEFLRDFFSEHIWYLGPLREEPRAIYPLKNDVAMNEVGYRGENTAAVYDMNKYKEVECIDPSAFNNLGAIDMQVRNIALKDAIGKWLVYLGVASDISTNDRGKIGHELKITNELSDMPQDLTHVGVGVSQVLPILVMSLLAKKGDVIILEQPELHLHPKVQTRLADFFVSMNALGKQCIVETHSEYLINRLRLLVALSDNTYVADKTMIYFVEKDKELGYSKYREIKINRYGNIPEWPDGFFDEGEDLSTKIMKAAAAKRRKEMQDLKK